MGKKKKWKERRFRADMAATKQSGYAMNYFNKTMKQVKLAMYQEQANQLEAFCNERGYKKQTFIKDAIREKIIAEGGSFYTDEEANEKAVIRKREAKEADGE